jgi:hypothetical protein
MPATTAESERKETKMLDPPIPKLKVGIKTATQQMLAMYEIRWR